jgi:hypothetical protein
MEASCAGKREYRDKGRRGKYRAHLGRAISPRHGPFSLGVRFETYELFISLIFIFFSGRVIPQVSNQRIQGHACTLKLCVLF